jgi:ABC-2 type transport system ATP-binding protein
MAAIELDGVAKRYGDDGFSLPGRRTAPVEALSDLDLTVEEGEIYGFLGPNGAGKSTTINILLDFVRPTAGRARVLGLDAQEEGKRVRERVGVLPEGFETYGRLTGRQHLEFAIESKGAADDPATLAERVGIADALDRKAGGYSKGMAQRLTLGMALVGEPDLLILDEPSTGLDPNGAREMRDIVEAERSRGATVFFSSHVLGQVEAVCDRVGILRDGELVAEDTVEGLRDAAGDGTTLDIEVARLPEDALSAVRALPGVSEVTANETSLQVACEDDAKSDVLSTLDESGAPVRDFTTTDASLEDVFATYTTGDREEVRA